IINGDGAIHDIAVPEFTAQSDQIMGKGSAAAIVFRANKNGVYEYLCTLPGHKAAGMFGKLIVGGATEKADTNVRDLSKNPNEVGKSVGKRGPEKVVVNLETTEVEGKLGDGSTYRYWTFNDTVPGPFVRVRVNDTVTVNMANAISSTHIHSI